MSLRLMHPWAYLLQSNNCNSSGQTLYNDDHNREYFSVLSNPMYTIVSSWPHRLHIVVVVVSSHHHPILSCSHELDSPFRTSYVAVTVPIWSRSLINCIPVCVSIHSRIQLMTQRGSTNNNVTLLFNSTRSTSITLES